MPRNSPHWIGALAILWLAPGVASAAEDGGEQSIFSQGIGNRALGMGAAYVAIADDATSTTWNPGGLGRVRRFEVQAGQTSYFGIGVTESYLAVVMPDWRWGAASATFRHFGVGGIERRDERNVLLDDDLSNSESEIGFGYGRPVGELWAFGAALKLRRQSVAGLGGNGLGLDVGVTGQPLASFGHRSAWVQNLTWGLSLANLVKPSVRLDRESVADPTVLRTGVAYLHSLTGLRAVLAAFDLEQSANGATGVNAGIELRLHPLLALRAGMNGGTMTGGSGMRWRDLALDYVYENRAIDPVHRFGLTYAFGPTVAESHQAALRVEEEATQSRFAEAFQKRQAEQVQALLDRAGERFAARRYDEALELLATVNAIEPGLKSGSKLEASCLHGKALELESAGQFAEAAVAFGNALSLAPDDSAAANGQRRCQEQSDLHAERSAELRRQFQAAMDDFGADDLSGARTGFRQILAREPSDQEAALMLSRTEQAIARKAQTLLEQADRYIRANLLREAASTLDQVGSLDPKAQGLASANTALSRARQRAESNPLTADALRRGRTTVAARPKLVGQQRKEVELLYRRGLAAMKEHRSDDALRYLELVWAADPDFQKAREYLAREYLMRGMESFAAGRLDEAVSFWERVLQVDPTDQKAIGYLARAQKQLSKTREILGNTR